jgi:hypothetical protein
MKKLLRNVPIFVTSDALYTVYLSLTKFYDCQTEHFIPPAIAECRVIDLHDEFTALQSTWEDAARRVVAFVGVGSKLLDPAVQIPDYASDLVNAELDLIESASGIQPSAIFPYLENGEDYTQYIPRGHYTRSDALKAYFKSMMWYGRMTYRLNTDDPEIGRAETRSALLLVHALLTSQVDGHPAVKAWLDLKTHSILRWQAMIQLPNISSDGSGLWQGCSIRCDC